MIETFYDELLKLSMSAVEAMKPLPQKPVPTNPLQRQETIRAAMARNKKPALPPEKPPIRPLGGNLPGKGASVPKEVLSKTPPAAPPEGKPVGAPSSKPIPELSKKPESPAPKVETTQAAPPPPAPKDPAPTTTTVTPVEGAPAAAPISSPFWTLRRKLMLGGLGLGAAGTYAGYKGLQGYQLGSAEGEEERRRRGLP